jgi:NAD+ kinase
MHVLLATKMTSLDLFGEYVRKKVTDGLLTPDHLEAMQRGHRDHQETFFSLREAFDRHGITHKAVSYGRYWPEVDQFDAVIAVGGDGTVLEASQHVDNSRVPILGLRSSPQSIGHLCAYDRTEIDSLIQDLKSQEFKFVLAHRLRAVIHSLNSNAEIQTQSILNDFLFCNANPAATTRYRISIDDKSEPQMSSGIWLSAPAGSSAAIQSAGGIPMSLSESKFQFKVRELYHPAGVKLDITGDIFDPDYEVLVIESLSESAILAPDGHQNSYALGYGDRITFQRAAPLCLVRRS